MSRFKLFPSHYAYPDPFWLENNLKKNRMLNERYANQTDFTENLASNVVKFSVYLDTTAYAEIEEEDRMSWSDLLGTIGGHFHLFLGMSLLSFVEIFEVLLEFNINADKYAV